VWYLLCISWSSCAKQISSCSQLAVAVPSVRTTNFIWKGTCWFTPGGALPKNRDWNPYMGGNASTPFHQSRQHQVTVQFLQERTMNGKWHPQQNWIPLKQLCLGTTLWQTSCGWLLPIDKDPFFQKNLQDLFLPMIHDTKTLLEKNTQALIYKSKISTRRRSKIHTRRGQMVVVCLLLCRDCLWKRSVVLLWRNVIEEAHPKCIFYREVIAQKFIERVVPWSFDKIPTPCCYCKLRMITLEHSLSTTRGTVGNKMATTLMVVWQK